MSAFFPGSYPQSTVTHGVARFDLPIRYFRDDCFVLFFSADYEAIKTRMPSDRMHPVTVGPGRAVLAIAAFNYIDNDIGPYGEVAIVAPVVYGRRPPPILPLLVESAWPGFGALVLHLPVTGTLPRDAGRGQWGYTKFVADMQFVNVPERHECRLSEAGEHILTLRVAKGGLFARTHRPLRTFSVLDSDLIETEIPQVGAYRWSPRCDGCALELGDHPVARELRELRLSAKPMMKRYFVERSGILPAGRIVERGVRPLDGYRGVDREGELNTTYLAGAA